MNGSYNFDPMTGKPIAGAAGTPPVQVPSKPKREYLKKEIVLAWGSALIGYLFCRTFWVWQKPEIGLLFTVCLFAFGFVFFGKRKRKARCFFYPVSALILSSALFFSSSPSLLFFTFIYICSAFLLFCQTGSEGALERRAGQLYVFETVKAFFVAPFKSIGAAVGAAFTNKGAKKGGKTLLIILSGLGIALIPTLIVFALLSFDGNFTDSLEAIRKAIFDKILTHVASILFGVPIGMFIYSSLYESAHPRPDSFNEEACIRIENGMKFAPPLVGAVAIAPLLFLYVVFIIAQRGYFAAVFTSTLPDAYTFADFARNGFFRLCAVAAINALALIALRVFSKKTNSGKISPVVKVYTVVLSLVTVVISGTAISQMIMYVSNYGLTRLRLYTLWFMALLILIFIVAILKQFIEKLPFAATAVTVFVLCFAALAVPDADAIIARHNYNCQLADTEYSLDVEYLGQLSPSSVPVLCEVYGNEDLPDSIRDAALRELGGYAARDVRPFNLPELKAEKAYAALDRETQLQAAVAYDGLFPHVFISLEEQSVKDGDYRFCKVSVCQYDKNEEKVITDNPEYKPFGISSRAAVLDKIGKYLDMCEYLGKESILPFGTEDLSDEGRFYVHFDGSGSSSSVCLYDRENAKLAILDFEDYGYHYY